MTHIIYIHALFLKSFTLKYLSHKVNSLIKQNDITANIHFFDYKSTQYNENILNDLKHKIDDISLKDSSAKIYLVGHSMGGLIGRLTVQKFPQLPIKSLITLGTPHNGSSLAKNLKTTPFSFILGSSGDSGILKSIPEWQQEIPLYCIAGDYHGKIFTNVFLPSNFDNLHNDGTVFVKEAILDNSTRNIIIDHTSHMQLVFSNEVANHISTIVSNT